MAVQISGNDITVPRDGSFTRNVTIGGTLTYEDVTNIDSVGLVTARSGIEIGARPGVAASISVDGNMIVSGISTFGGDVQVPDKIIHAGDTNTALRFPAADTITAETGGSERLRIASDGTTTATGTSDGVLQLDTSDSRGAFMRFGQGGSYHHMVGCADGLVAGPDKEDLALRAADNMVFCTNGANERLRIDSSGRLLAGTTTEGHENADNLTLEDSAAAGITLRSASTQSGGIFFSDGTSGAAEYAGILQYDHDSNYMRIYTNGSEKLRIRSDGNLLLGTTTDSGNKVTLYGTNTSIVMQNASTGTGSGQGFYLGNGNDTIAYVWNYENNDIRFATNNTERMKITYGGNVEITNLCVASAGLTQVDNAQSLISQSSVGSSSQTYYIGNQAIQTSSDRRIKENIIDTEINALSKLEKVKVVDFDWNDPSDTSINNKNSRGKWTGCIAQEIVDVFPHAVNAPRPEGKEIDHNSEDLWTIQYEHLVPVLIKAVQELSAEVKTLKQKKG